jgi:hypothetical protein
MQAAANMTYEDLKEAVEGLFVRECAPIITPLLPGCFTPLTLPMEPLAAGDNLRVHFIEEIAGYSGPLDIPALQTKYKEATAAGDFGSLPEPFGTKTPLVAGTLAQLQICVTPWQEAGKYTITKHWRFPKSIKPAVFQNIAFGKANKLKFNEHPKTGVKIWQYCWENLGGYHFRCFHLSPEGKVAAGKESGAGNLNDKSDEDIDTGFKYIEDNATGLNGVKLLLWTTKALKNQTPIRGWPVALVKEIQRLISTEGALVKKEMCWPLTLTRHHFHGWVLDILENIWDFDIAALGLLGESNKGKSPLGRSVLMAQCRCNKKRFGVVAEPCIRVTTEFDFLRGERGNVCMGDFLDDGTKKIIIYTTTRNKSLVYMKTSRTRSCFVCFFLVVVYIIISRGSVFAVILKLLLAFTDVGLFEAMAWARWGATKWVQGQPRAFSDNAYKNLDTQSEWPTLTKAQFIQVIEPAIHKDASPAHVDAVLKRTAFIAFTPGWVAWRPAGVNEDEVKRTFLSDVDMLTDEGKLLYGRYKNGHRDLPANHEEMVAEEQLWVYKVLTQRQQKRHQALLTAQPRGSWFSQEPRRNPVEPLGEEDPFNFGGGLDERPAPCVSKKLTKQGCEFLKSHGPMDEEPAIQRAWVDEEVRKPESLVFGWDKETCMKTLKRKKPTAKPTDPSAGSSTDRDGLMEAARQALAGAISKQEKTKQEPIQPNTFECLRSFSGTVTDLDDEGDEPKRVKKDPEELQALSQLFHRTNAELVRELGGACILIDDE